MQIDKSTRLRLLQRQVARLQRRLAAYQQRSEQFVRWRVALFVVLVVAVFGVFSQVGTQAGYIAALLALVIFNIVAWFHRRLRAGIRRHEGWLAIKQTHIARIQLDWARIPLVEGFAPPDHPFASDLDLVGRRSLHQLLDTAVSLEGSARLLDWLLLTEPDAAALATRQAQVRELARLGGFRDRLALNGQMQGRITGSRVLDWFAAHADPGPRWYDMLLLCGLALVTALSFVLTAALAAPPLWVGTLLIYILYAVGRGAVLGDVFGEGLALRGMFESLQAVFGYLETARYGRQERLAALLAPFHDPARRPSALLRRIGWLVAAASIRGNPALWFTLNLLLPWDYLVAYQFQRRKAEAAAQMPRWLEAWFELEALCSLATFAHLNPEYTFPQVGAQPGFCAEQVGHPLIPYTEKVCNDFALQEIGAVVIITGSNMAGKSSFLRTLGVNLVLAYAGAPVNARRLETGRLRLFTCIKVSDSVTDGFSYFYAEVRRLKALLNALEREHPAPLFFLIDEIFKGTNNRERLAGSRAYIRALVGRHCLGLVSTHDLELVRLADELPQVRNQHFREEVRDGRMVFDYHLRSGPCPTTNALKIMALEGLPVDPL